MVRAIIKVLSTEALAGLLLDGVLTVLRPVSARSANAASTCLHLNSTAMQVGQSMTQGHIIGYVGTTGTTEFYHRHFEIRQTASNDPMSSCNPLGYPPQSDVKTRSIRIANLVSEPLTLDHVTAHQSATRRARPETTAVHLYDRAKGKMKSIFH
jgi:hypothetical protein